MFIHPWDAAQSKLEWQQWLNASGRFGSLAVNNLNPSKAPIVLPTHFTLDGEEIFMHFAKPNPAWPHLVAAADLGAEVVVAVTGDYAFVPGSWRAAAGVDPMHGVPTSYYAAVQFIAKPTVIDDPEQKLEVLKRQMADFQSDESYAALDDESAPFLRMLPGIRALRLEVLEVLAKFKFDDHKPVEFRQAVSAKLVERESIGGSALDGLAARQQLRRLAEIGLWKPNDKS